MQAHVHGARRGDVSAEEPDDFRKKFEAAAWTGPLWSSIPSASNGRGTSRAVFATREAPDGRLLLLPITIPTARGAFGSAPPE